MLFRSGPVKLNQTIPAFTLSEGEGTVTVSLSTDILYSCSLRSTINFSSVTVELHPSPTSSFLKLFSACSVNAV